ncbi:NB-ARC domain-containing protein [Actinopolyspora lacussalsi subsp. righensis]|uniref:NB-ARC domain-containing protein n=1 Tax=Actinopolyspora righensis TaxID=995060 RepID=A0A1I6X6H1_9ACTN|nr:NB-ARC domain-containing protein [Actinopolyspora righensis]
MPRSVETSVTGEIATGDIVAHGAANDVARTGVPTTRHDEASDRTGTTGVLDRRSPGHLPGRIDVVPVAAHQLPPPSGLFVGRTSELNRMEAWHRENSERALLVALTGSGGIGKTTLACHWLRQHERRFPDGQLYVDAGTRSAEHPIAAAELLGRLLRALGVPPERVPLEMAERLSWYRSITAGRSLSVLVDNVVSTAQVRPLLPESATSTLLVTSRSRLVGLTMEGARFMELAPLNAEDVVHILSRKLGRSRVSREMGNARLLAKLCAGSPLAATEISAWLAARPHRSLAHAANLVREQRKRLTTLPRSEDFAAHSVVDICYQGLSPQAATLYRRLAQHPRGDLPVALTHHLAGIEGSDSERVLAELRDARLLGAGEQRYWFHDLVLAHARTMSLGEDSPGVRRRTLHSVIDWYIGRAVEADLVITPRRPRFGRHYPSRANDWPVWDSPESALDWFERERGNLRAVIIEAHHNQWDEPVWQLCEAMWGFFFHRKHYRDWIDSHRLGIEAASRLGHPLAESRLRCQLAFAYLDLEHFDEAMDVCLPAPRLPEAGWDSAELSTTLSELTSAARRGSGHDDAGSNTSDERPGERKIVRISSAALSRARAPRAETTGNHRIG